MSESKPVSFDQIIAEGRRKRKAEQLAEEIFGKRRSSTPSQVNSARGLGASLASRVGVNKRTSSVPRTNASHQQAAAALERRPRPAKVPSTNPVSEAPARRQEVTQSNGEDELYIRGASRTIFTVVASNFAPGTTATDIESVMENVGGVMSRCTLVASNPTVIAEMDFHDRSGADKVVETFNGKKADGRVLYVYMKSTSGARVSPHVEEPRATYSAPPEDVSMAVDANAQSREHQDRLREQHRGGRDDHDVFPRARPTNPRNYDYYDVRQGRAGAERESGYEPRAGPRYNGGGRGRQYGDNRYYGNGQWR